MIEERFMRRAIELALKGKGFTNPNPMVGAVIVREASEENKEAQIVAEGWHHKCGDLHAERDAIKNARNAGISIQKCTIYVTLEPCCHHGKQPPCVEAIVESGISKVVVGSRDPNPLVNGGGVKYLQDRGIEVVQDFLKDECDEINPVFFHYIKTGLPYVIVKYAMTADGLTATSSGESKWITGEKARQNVHKTRAETMAIMCGIGTASKDNPTLNARISGNVRQPVRVLLDSKLNISADNNLIKTANNTGCGPLMIFCSENLGAESLAKKASFEKEGIKIHQVEVKNQKLSVYEVLKTLGKMGIDSVFVESGGSLNASLFFEEERKLVNELQVYIAPKIFGNDGERIFSPVRGKGIGFPEEAYGFSKPQVEFFDDDILLTFRTK